MTVTEFEKSKGCAIEKPKLINLQYLIRLLTYSISTNFENGNYCHCHPHQKHASKPIVTETRKFIVPAVAYGCKVAGY